MRASRHLRYWLRLLTRPRQVELHGVTLELPPGVSKAVRTAIWSERYERGEARCVRRKITPDDVVLEVGSGIGFLSTLCALSVGSERVHTFEADPALMPVIRRTFELNGVSPRLVHAVLGEGVGQETFHVEEDLFSSSLLRRSKGARTVEVPRLDANAEIARVRPTLLVVDIEGGERELLPRLDLGTVGKLVLEMHPQLIGRDGVAAVEASLDRWDFRLDRSVSSTRKRFYSRTRSLGG